VHWLRPEREKYGLINRYAAPEKLGADRYAALIAAARLRVGNCVVVSVGTATTIDALSQLNNQQSEFMGGEFMGGEFMGGVILPGPAMMRAALLQGTGQIERKMMTAVPLAQASSLAFSQDTFSQAIFPQDTAAAVESGIVLAQVGAVHAMRDRMTQADAAPPLVILTGGARGEIRDGLQVELIDIEDLVLEGLAWIALESEVASR
jgi:type III pantothenate kinase